RLTITSVSTATVSAMRPPDSSGRRPVSARLMLHPPSSRLTAVTHTLVDAVTTTHWKLLGQLPMPLGMVQGIVQNLWLPSIAQKPPLLQSLSTLQLVPRSPGVSPNPRTITVISAESPRLPTKSTPVHLTRC